MRNLDVKTNFENFDFQVLPTPTLTFILMKTHLFQTSNMNCIQNLPINVDFDSKIFKMYWGKTHFF